MRLCLLLPVVLCLPLCAQQTTSESPQQKPATSSVSATTRLLNAKTVFLRNVSGNGIPFEIINNAIIGWPRYTVVEEPQKADLLIEVTSPEDPNKKKEENGGTSIKAGAGGRDPRALQVPTPTYSGSDVKLIVRDAHTKAVLWAGSEPAKEAFRQAKTDQNLIDAAQKLVRRFHDRVEPTPPSQ